MMPAPRSRRLPWALLALLSCLPARAASPPDWNAPTAQWRQGPVRHLLTEPEARAFGRLRTGGQRAAFVEAFWLRRDPTPGTERNEFLDQFTDRLEGTEALRLHYESMRPMWQTDLGRAYLLLGPPRAEESDRDSRGRARVIWSYGDLAGTPDGHLELVFVADEDDEMHLSDPAQLDSLATNGLAAAASAYAALQLDAAVKIPPARARAIRAAELALPGGRLGNPRTGEAGTFPVDLAADFYRADDGTTYVAITLAPAPGNVPADEASRLVPFGGIISLDDPQIDYSFAGDDRFAPAPEVPGTFQTGLGIDPGRYRLRFGLAAPGDGRVGVHTADLLVPDLGGARLELSSLTLARTLRPLPAEEVPGPGLKTPFILGNLRVVPRTDRTLQEGDELILYYQVYGAEPDADGELFLDASYQFHGKVGDGWEAIGAPIDQPALDGEVQAWRVPIRGWPPGTFRITVQVTDRNSGHSATTTTTFQVTEPRRASSP